MNYVVLEEAIICRAVILSAAPEYRFAQMKPCGAESKNPDKVSFSMLHQGVLTMHFLSIRSMLRV